MRRCAFTLIELLVVIAILAILAAILFPVFAQAREKGRTSACLGNLKQLGTAVSMYVDDYDESVPFARMGMAGPMGSSLSWTDTVQPYLKNRQILRCPSDAGSLWTDPTTPRHTSYGINGYFTPNHPPYWGVSLPVVIHPAETIALAELVETVTADHFMPMFYGDPPRVENAMVQMGQWDAARWEPKTLAIRRHAAGMNVAYLDGHAKWVIFGTTFRQIPGQARTIDQYDPKFDG